MLPGIYKSASSGVGSGVGVGIGGTGFNFDESLFASLMAVAMMETISLFPYCLDYRKRLSPVASFTRGFG